MPGWRDEATIILLERDGVRLDVDGCPDPRDYLACCVWCGLEFWVHGGADHRVPLYCSHRCWTVKNYWYECARGGSQHQRAARRRARYLAKRDGVKQCGLDGASH